MRLAAAIFATLLVTGCSAAVATSPASPTPFGQIARDTTILTSDGGVLRPIPNGGRVALRSGWAAVRLAPGKLEDRGRLEVTVFDADGRQASADVSVDYASMDMDHGHTLEHGVVHEGCYRMPLTFVMPGSWRLVVRIARGGADETFTLVLPDVGM